MPTRRKTPHSGRPETSDRHLLELAEIEVCKLELQETQRLLEEARYRYTDLFDTVPVGYLTLDESGHTLEINQAGATMLGRDRAHMIGKQFIAWLAENERPLFLKYLHKAFHSATKASTELTVKTPRGTLCEMRLENVIAKGAVQPRICRTIMTDLSQTRKAEQASNLASRVIESAAEGIMVTDAQNMIVSVNPAFEKSTGYSAQEAIGESPSLLHSGRHDESFYQEMWAALDKQGQWQGEIWNRHKSGEIYPEWLSISTVRNAQESVTNYVGIFSDAHTQEHVLERLHYLAYYDGLTGLPNRRLFLDRLSLSISQARRNHQQLAVMFVDLDNFKQINDTMGHRFGDALLMSVTERMKACLRDGDTLARLGGDEFTVILPTIPHADAAINVARKIIDSYAIPVFVEGNAVQITASIGISIFPEDGSDADDLLNHADIAMYKIKQTGRNGYWRHGWADDRQA
ncbi:MAG: diguanylate cyclase [Sulfuricella sp.]